MLSPQSNNLRPSSAGLFPSSTIRRIRRLQDRDVWRTHNTLHPAGIGVCWQACASWGASLCILGSSSIPGIRLFTFSAAIFHRESMRALKTSSRRCQHPVQRDKKQRRALRGELLLFRCRRTIRWSRSTFYFGLGLFHLRGELPSERLLIGSGNLRLVQFGLQLLSSCSLPLVTSPSRLWFSIFWHSPVWVGLPKSQKECTCSMLVMIFSEITQLQSPLPSQAASDLEAYTFSH